MHLRSILRDYGEILLEIVFLILMTLSPWLFHLKLTLDPISKPEQITWYLASSYGKFPLAVGLFIFCLLAIRKYNKDSILNSTGLYHDYPFFLYRLAAFLGYKKCNLVGVPIHLQIRVVMCQLFERYPTQQVYKEIETDSAVTVVPSEPDYSSKEVNLLVADSYDITMEQLPPNCHKFYTIKIARMREKGVRVYSPEFIEKVVATIASLSDNCVVHYFATTNPKNQEQITLQAFMKGGRGNIGRLIIYQQSADEPRLFTEKVTITG